jgi:hypothetical protein
MADFKSFTRHEHDLSHKYRNDLNHAESSEDVKKFFTYAMQELLKRVLGESVVVRFEDVALAADSRGYAVSARIGADAGFARAMAESDLGAIMQRFAETAQHRLHHLQLHAQRGLSQTRRR